MGGSACASLILDGNDALAAIDFYGLQSNPADVFLLKHRIEASCQLVGYESVYLQHEGTVLPETLTEPIDYFHKHIAAHLLTMTLEEIQHATVKIGKLNDAVKDFIDVPWPHSMS